jgi:predicted transcriptional regulator of viral defense system
MYRIRNTDYLQKLIQSGKRVFKVSDIAILWGINDKNKLHTYLKRYTENNILFRLAKGIYSIVEPQKLHVYEIGTSVAGDLSYISLETVLFLEGKINQPVYKITLIGKKSKEFVVNDQAYICHYLPQHKLVDRQGILEKDGYAIANVERAMADMHEVKPQYFMDSRT